MKFYVNERCVACGLCADVCPEVFVMTQEGPATAKAQPEGGVLAAKATEAMEGCPVNAIQKA